MDVITCTPVVILCSIVVGIECYEWVSLDRTANGLASMNFGGHDFVEWCLRFLGIVVTNPRLMIRVPVMRGVTAFVSCILYILNHAAKWEIIEEEEKKNCRRDQALDHNLII